MKTYTIKQKSGDTGSIHDIASSKFDRDIKFPQGHKYAIILASYYGGKGYTTHKTEEAAIRQSRKMAEYSHKIIGTDGNGYTVHYGPDGARLRPQQ